MILPELNEELTQRLDDADAKLAELGESEIDIAIIRDVIASPKGPLYLACHTSRDAHFLSMESRDPKDADVLKFRELLHRYLSITKHVSTLVESNDLALDDLNKKRIKDYADHTEVRIGSVNTWEQDFTEIRAKKSTTQTAPSLTMV